MPEQEKRAKVIKGLEICSAGEWNSTGGRNHTDCPYYPAGYTGCTCKPLMLDALALLKAQEPDETRLVRHYSRPNVYADLWLHCEKCGGRVDDRYKPKFCPECGRKVNWE